jgi:hypothetical protein
MPLTAQSRSAARSCLCPIGQTTPAGSHIVQPECKQIYFSVAGGSFPGGGLSFWDITHSDTFTPALMLRFGAPLGTHPAHPVYFVGEGRLFLKELDDVSNNYQFWAGVRVHF